MIHAEQTMIAIVLTEYKKLVRQQILSASYQKFVFHNVTPAGQCHLIAERENHLKKTKQDSVQVWSAEDGIKWRKSLVDILQNPFLRQGETHAVNN